MTTWGIASGMYGYRISPTFDISLFGDGGIAIISWNAIVPSDTSLTVETNVSLNGTDWLGFKPVINAGKIPDIEIDTDLSNAKFKYKVTFTTSNATVSPKLQDLQGNFTPVIHFINDGDIILKPEIWIDKIGFGDFKIINVSNHNKEFAFTGLVDQETVYVHNEREQILTDLAKTYRYKDFNDNYLELLQGVNVLQVVGNSKIHFRYQYKTLQG